MAISLSGATISSLSSDHATNLASSNLSCFSALHFPPHLPCFRLLPNKALTHRWRPRPRILPIVKARKQSFSSFDDLLANCDKPVLVDFYATWCGPCQFMVPVLNEVSATMQDKIQVVKIDTEKYPSIANKYSIEALPTFIIFKNGEPCDRFEGALSADQLIQRIEATLEVKQQ